MIFFHQRPFHLKGLFDENSSPLILPSFLSSSFLEEQEAMSVMINNALRDITRINHIILKIIINDFLNTESSHEKQK